MAAIPERHDMQRIHTDDQSTKAMIQAKGKTAPRVTPADLAANIASENYFTAKDGVIGDLFTSGLIDDPDGHGLPPALGLLTFCVLVLQNGFTVTGESACASPENFDAEIGRKIARENAVQKAWPLMGYALKERLHERALFDASPKTSDQERMQAHVDMVRESGWTPGDGAGQSDQ